VELPQEGSIVTQVLLQLTSSASKGDKMNATAMNLVAR